MNVLVSFLIRLDIDSLSKELISNTNGVVDDENSTSALGIEPFALKI